MPHKAHKAKVVSTHPGSHVKASHQAGHHHKVVKHAHKTHRVVHRHK